MATGGVALTALEEPQRTIMFYDQSPWPDGSRLIAFWDGHCTFEDAAAWPSFEKSLHLKLRRSAQPLPANYWKMIAPDLDIGASTN